MPADATAYWEGRFAALIKTASWKKYVQENELEESFLPGEQFGKAMQATTQELRDQYVKAGVKVVR
jgi:tripartite-type tricarboxylate transporter receptor subunit TctC